MRRCARCLLGRFMTSMRLEQVSQLAEALTGELPALSALPKPPVTVR
jgi:hypothetical protein